MKQSQWKPRKCENTKKKKDSPSTTTYYCGESSKNSVVCEVAWWEFALELWDWSSKLDWYAVAKRLKMSCDLPGSAVLPFLDSWEDPDKQASGVQLEPRKLIRHCPKRALWTRLAVRLECWVTRTSCIWSALVGLRFLQMRKNSWPSLHKPPMVERMNGRQLLILRSLPCRSLWG